MLNLLLAAILFVPPPPAETLETLPPIQWATIVDGHAFMVHKDQGTITTTLAPISVLEVVEWPQGVMPIVAVRKRPVIYDTSYKDKTGLEHRVVTDCKLMTLAKCAEMHKRALAALQRVFPRSR